MTSSWYCSVIGQVSSDPGEVYWIGLHDLNGEGIYQWLDEADEVRENPLRICIKFYHTFENIVVDFFVFDPFIYLQYSMIYDSRLKLMVQLYLYPQAEYINWGKGQPNNKGDGGQDCVGIGSKIVKGGKFNDEDCNAPGKFICEKPAKGSIKAEQKCG